MLEGGGGGRCPACHAACALQHTKYAELIQATSKTQAAHKIHLDPGSTQDPSKIQAAHKINLINIKLLTSFDGGDIHQESWSWVGSKTRPKRQKQSCIMHVGV